MTVALRMIMQTGTLLQNNDQSQLEKTSLKKDIEMVAILEKTTNENPTVNASGAETFLNVSRFGNLHDDVTMAALRRAAEIRQGWSEEEIARRKQVGEERREQLSQMLVAVEMPAAAAR